MIRSNNILEKLWRKQKLPPTLTTTEYLLPNPYIIQSKLINKCEVYVVCVYKFCFTIFVTQIFNKSTREIVYNGASRKVPWKNSLRRGSEQNIP